jgi:acylphosphatase
VSGAVQGVGYRAFARRVASRLGLVGFARNLADGRVEVIAVGPVETVAQLEAALREGPLFGRVDRIDVSQAKLEINGLTDFQIR